MQHAVLLGSCFFGREVEYAIMSWNHNILTKFDMETP